MKTLRTKSEKNAVDRRKGGAPDPGFQPSLFEVEPQGEGILGDLDYCQAAEPAEARAVDLKGANEYGLATAQLSLFEASGQGKEGDRAHGLGVEGDADGERQGAEQEVALEAADAPEPFLKLIARIAMRTGQKPMSKEGGSK